jgi:hypothetical protein
MPTKIEWTNQHAPKGESGLCYAGLFASRAMHAHFRGVAADGKWTGSKLAPASAKNLARCLHMASPHARVHMQHERLLA